MNGNKAASGKKTALAGRRQGKARNRTPKKARNLTKSRSRNKTSI
jgi:hypothetical protein